MIDAARLLPQRTIVDEKARLSESIRRIRSLPNWGTIPIVFIPEDGPPGAGEKLWDHIRHQEPIICMAEAGSLGNGVHRFGVPKTQESTMSSKDMLVEMLTAGRLCFSEHLFCLEHVHHGSNLDKQLEKLQFQLLAYRAGIKKIYAEYHNDDLVTGLLQLVAWSDKFIRPGQGRSDYRNFQQKWISRAR